MALIAASRKCDLNEVRRLIRRGLHVNARSNDEVGYTALNWACEIGSLGVVQCLVEEGQADVLRKDLKGCSGLYRAAKHNHLEIVKYLASKDNSLINEASLSGWTPFSAACFNGHDEMARYLLLQGADVEKKGGPGRSTPLMMASQEGHLSTVRLLVETYKVDVNAKDADGRTAFFAAVQSGHLEVVRYLLRNGADIDETDDENCGPLYMACHRGHVAVAAFLVKEKANVEITFDGMTPLMNVCDNGRLDLARILVEEGSADLTKVRDGNKALDFARRRNHLEIVAYLEREEDSMRKTNLESENKRLKEQIEELKTAAKSSSNLTLNPKRTQIGKRTPLKVANTVDIG